ncbi:MAG: hypothetical protein CSA11_03940 [Chloroflexi bacterium]|nr:MAG: hypothetical protein CSA11_03940 [Chloroflexota bacterium]
MDDEFENKDEFPQDSMPDMSASDMDISDDDKLWVMLAWVLTPLVPIIIMLMADKKERPFIRAHNGQALIWGLLTVLFGFALGSFLCGIPGLIMWLIGCYWGWQGYQGSQVEIPVVTNFVKDQGWA